MTQEGTERGVDCAGDKTKTEPERYQNISELFYLFVYAGL